MQRNGKSEGRIKSGRRYMSIVTLATDERKVVMMPLPNQSALRN